VSASFSARIQAFSRFVKVVSMAFCKAQENQASNCVVFGFARLSGTASESRGRTPSPVRLPKGRPVSTTHFRRRGIRARTLSSKQGDLGRSAEGASTPSQSAPAPLAMTRVWRRSPPQGGDPCLGGQQAKVFSLCFRTPFPRVSQTKTTQFDA